MATERDVILARLSKGPLKTRCGDFDVSVFHDGHEEAVVLSKGDLGGQRNVICRIHSECLSSHVFLSDECDCTEQMLHAQELMSSKGLGLIIYLRQEGRGSGAAAHVSTLALKKQGVPQHEAYKARGYSEDARTYRIAAKIIKFLQIESICLISSNLKKKEEMESLGVVVSNRLDLTDCVTILDRRTTNIADYAGLGIQEPIRHSDDYLPRIFVVGDLNVDYLLSQRSFKGGGTMEKPKPLVGGTAINAARAFKSAGFHPILFGKVGRDQGGNAIRHELQERKITSLLGESPDLPTGECTVIYFEDERKRVMIREDQNANDYDLENLRQALKMAQVDNRDFSFLVGHEFVRSGALKMKSLVEVLVPTGAKIILDIVPHDMYEKVTLSDFCEAISNNVSVLIGEFPTFMAFIGREVADRDRPTNRDIRDLFAQFSCDVLVVRYGVGCISQQVLCRRQPGNEYETLEDKATGYEAVPDDEKRGFGDRLTADLIKRFLKDIF